MIFDSTIARNSIYLDFEGEGKSKKAGIPLPHMAGIFRPNPVSGGGGRYEAVFFRESWKAPMNGSSGKGRISDFCQTMEELIKEVSEKNSFIVHWSVYEYNVIEMNAPQILSTFDSISYNILPPYRKIKNRRKIVLDETNEKVLNQYVSAFFPNRKLVSPPKPGPAELCKRIDHFSDKYKRWRNWPTDKKQYLNDLLNYNEEDCRATWLLARKLGNMNCTTR